jgi:hypothetical protein
VLNNRVSVSYCGRSAAVCLLATNCRAPSRCFSIVACNCLCGGGQAATVDRSYLALALYRQAGRRFSSSHFSLPLSSPYLAGAIHRVYLPTAQLPAPTATSCHCAPPRPARANPLRAELAARCLLPRGSHHHHRVALTMASRLRLPSLSSLCRSMLALVP